MHIFNHHRRTIVIGILSILVVSGLLLVRQGAQTLYDRQFGVPEPIEIWLNEPPATPTPQQPSPIVSPSYKPGLIAYCKDGTRLKATTDEACSKHGGLEMWSSPGE